MNESAETTQGWSASRAGRWAAWALVVAVVYVLSFAPVMSCAAHGKLSDGQLAWVNRFYAPLWFVKGCSPYCEMLYYRYHAWCSQRMFGADHP